MTTPGPPPFEVRRVRAPAARIHAAALPDPAHALVRLCEVPAPALVLGSAQPLAHVDAARAAAAGVDVVRRRSGGGAVLVEPGRVLWVDVVVPADHPRWEPDVGRAFWWLGDVWVAALAGLGVAAGAHRGPLLRTRWSPWVCFAGLGPGEVTLAGAPGGGKVVGMAQRRARGGSLFQCAALLDWDPARLVDLLALEGGARAEAASALAPAGAPLGMPAAQVEAAFLGALAAAGSD